jgi:uncharacterized membrane protein
MDLLQDYFLNPILSNGWFNPVNSIAYGIILVAAVYLVFKMLKKMRISIDHYFLYAIVPFILWAAVTRVLHDAAYYGALTGAIGEFFSLPIFPTPGSYFITFTVALIALFISLLLQKYAKLPYWKVMLVIGLALDAINFALLPTIDPLPMLMVLGITGLWTSLFVLLYKFSQSTNFAFLKQLFTLENSLLLSAHMLDASATYVAMTFFGYGEQHPLPRFLIELSNPAAMFLLKIVVLIPVLCIIDRYSEKGDFRNFLKIVILILGLAPGLRDAIRLMVGV